MAQPNQPDPSVPQIKGVPLLQACGACGSREFQVSTTPGPAATSTKLPYLRCMGCQRVYGHDRHHGGWEHKPHPSPSLQFVTPDEGRVLVEQWNR